MSQNSDNPNNALSADHVAKLKANNGAHSPTISGWELYPMGVDDFDAFECDAEAAGARLRDQAKITFSDDEVFVDFIDALATSQYKSDHKPLKKAEDVLKHMETSAYDLRIISILRNHTLFPLLVPYELLIKILKFHNIGPRFLDLLPAFRPIVDLSEKGNEIWSVQRVSKDVTEICYKFRYIEKNNHARGGQWSERQIGVHHKFGGEIRAVMVLLHANCDSKAHARLQKVFSNGQYGEQSTTSPLSLHTLIFSSYLDNWRPYLQSLGDTCREKEDQFVTIGLKHPSLCFRELQDMRDLESQLIMASTMLQSSIATIEGLLSYGRDLVVRQSTDNSTATAAVQHLSDPMLSPELRHLSILAQKGKGYLQSVCLIQQRTGVVIGLLSDGLNQQSQKIANQIADSSYALTLKSVNDSYIVKVVTLITVVYLPMQGVATFFGMNFTEFNQNSERLNFANNSWLFLATAGPLTLVTLGGLWYAWGLEKKRKSEQERRQNTV